MSDQNQKEKPGAPVKAPGIAGSIASLLGSLKFSLGVVVIIALACIAGTLIPQGEQVSRYLMKNPGSHKGLELMSSLGLTHVFSSWWFAALLCVLAASLLVCTGRRFQAIRRSSGAMRVRVAGSFVTHVSLLLVLVGGVVRVLWGEKGVLELSEGQEATACVGVAGMMPIPFTVRLVDFELEHYKTPGQALEAEGDALLVQWPEKGLAVKLPVELMKTQVIAPSAEPPGPDNTFRVTIERYIPDFFMDSATGGARSRSDQPNNPALYVSVVAAGSTNAQWVFARFPDFSRHGGQGGAGMPLQFKFVSGSANPAAMGRPEGPVKAFRSTVELIENGQVVLKKTIAVNSPMSHRGYTFYQLSYNPNDLTWTALQVVRDPGVPIVYAGFLLMMVGLTVVFCVGPYMDDKRKKTGVAA